MRVTVACLLVLAGCANQDSETMLPDQRTDAALSTDQGSVTFDVSPRFDASAMDTQLEDMSMADAAQTRCGNGVIEADEECDDSPPN